MRLATLTLFAALAFAGDPFRYQDFSLETDLSTLVRRFPLSRHEFCCVNGFTVSPPDQAAEFRDLVAHGTGQYLIRLTKAESVGSLYYVTAKVAGGTFDTLRLSFEAPDVGPGRSGAAGLANLESRHPDCAPVLANLVRRYGKAAGPEVYVEERLASRTYSWKQSGEQLALVCGNYYRRRKVFAMEVILKRTPK